MENRVTEFEIRNSEFGIRASGLNPAIADRLELRNPDSEIRNSNLRPRPYGSS